MVLAVVVKGEHERQKLEALRCKNRSWVLERSGRHFYAGALHPREVLSAFLVGV